MRALPSPAPAAPGTWAASTAAGASREGGHARVAARSLPLPQPVRAVADGVRRVRRTVTRGLRAVPYEWRGRAGPGAGSWLAWPARNAATWSIQAMTAWCPARAAVMSGHLHTRW